MKKKRPVIFLDRDGTLLYDRPGYYLRTPDKLRLYPYTATALKKLKAEGYALVVVTNQSGVGRGYLTEDTLEEINDKLQRLLRKKGVELDGIYCCLHHPDERCKCRKPKPYLAMQAVRELNLTLDGAAVMGDKKADSDLARNLKVPSVFVMTGHGRNELMRYGRRIGATHTAKNLEAGVKWWLRNKNDHKA